MDDLGEGAAFDGVAIVEISQSVRIFYCRQVIKLLFFDSCIIIAIDDGRVDFAKVGGTVCLVADAVGRNILIFDLVWVMTKGGPINSTELVSTYAYRLSFEEFQFSKGAAAANILFLILLVVGVFYIKLINEEEEIM